MRCVPEPRRAETGREEKKKREIATAHSRATSLVMPESSRGLAREAARFAPGASFISATWRATDPQALGLVTVVVTRRLPGGLLVPAIALVDRTCLGVKNALVGRAGTEGDLNELLDRLGKTQGGMETCDLLLAQSVVFNAIDYARTLGFSPHADFPESLFGPRPEALLDTPLARPAMPIYMSGPNDNPARVIAQLTRAVGEGNFHYLVGEPLARDAGPGG